MNYILICINLFYDERSKLNKIWSRANSNITAFIATNYFVSSSLLWWRWFLLLVIGVFLGGGLFCLYVHVFCLLVLRGFIDFIGFVDDLLETNV